MYPVSELYKNKIKELERTFETKIQIQHSLGVLNLTDKDIVSGSLVYTESSQASEDFTIGGTVASDIEFSILNKPEYADIEFMGATVLVSIGLELIEGNDVWEYVPLGVFNIDDVNKQRNTIQIKAIDNMINLDKPYSLSQLGYPATLFQIYVDLCNVCDVMPGTVDFPNKNYVVQERPVGDYTCRDILGYIAELSGTFARMNRHGALELTWYKPTGLILAPANRFNFRPRDDKIRITGVIATVDDTTYIAGTDEYAVDLSENPLLQGDYETVLPNIYNNIKDTEFTPFESNWQGNPAIQAGDMITQIDRDGKVYPTLVTSSTYKYRGSSTLKAEGLPMAAKGYKGSTNKKITNIIRKEIKPISDQLTTLEQTQLHATQLIANMLGGYAIQTPEAFYVADNPDLQQAQKVWKFGLGGFGYSENGVEGPYETAITADGSIVAMLVAAGIVTADMVKTGQLRSVDGSTRINLDDGSFNFKEVLKYENGKLVINDLNYVQTGVSYKGTTIDLQRGIYVEFTDGGHAQIGDGSILVQHVDGSHTVIDGRGIMRLFSIPIFEEVPSDTDIIDDFETGLIADTRVDLSRSEMYGDATLEELITVTNADKYAGVYSLKVQSPKESIVITGQHWVEIGDTGFWAYEGYYYSYVKCEFLNYKPTKDTTLSFKYKTYNSLPTKFSINLYVDDLDYPDIPTKVYSLSSTSWSSMSVLLTANHTYKVWVRISGSSDFDDGNLLKNKQAYVYIDDMSWELDVNESVIVGYEEGTKPYNDFTYIRKDEIPTGTTQKQIVLPDYFRGMNFDVLVTPLENYATPTLLSINNKIPSFTVSGANTKFMYTVILNN